MLVISSCRSQTFWLYINSFTVTSDKRFSYKCLRWQKTLSQLLTFGTLCLNLSPEGNGWHVEMSEIKYNNTSINVNDLLGQCTDSSNGNQSHPLYHLTKITKLLQYNIDSLHESKYLVAPKVITFSISSLLKKHIYQKLCFCFYSHKI